jgi:BirA family biotin operon repressor/biotin-[acetyl-CoA-carboxylase] ligase
VTIGSEVRVVLPGDRKLIGTARAIDREGRLIIDCGGESVAVSAGDVFHLRPRDKNGL